MAPHSSILAWKIPRTEEPGRLQSMGLLRVGHDWNDLAAAAVCICQMLFLSSTQLVSLGEGNGSPLHYSCLGNPTDRGAWWATTHGIAKSWTRLKWLSTHTHEIMWWLSFCDWFISLSMMSSRFMCVIAHSGICFFFKAEWYSIICIYRIFLFIHPPMYFSVVYASWLWWLALQRNGSADNLLEILISVLWELNPFFNRVISYFLLSCKGSLYILDIFPKLHGLWIFSPIP